jgi:hypothetical protein
MDLQGSTTNWHAEDWGQQGETNQQLAARRRALTTVKQSERNTRNRLSLMEQYDGVVEFVEYRRG